MTTEQPAAKMPPLWVIKLRAPFFTADVVPVCVGTAVAWARAGEFNLWLFLVTLFGAVCINAGTNMTNDYFDHKWGSDEVNTEFANPFTGGLTALAAVAMTAFSKRKVFPATSIVSGPEKRASPRNTSTPRPLNRSAES